MEPAPRARGAAAQTKDRTDAAAAVAGQAAGCILLPGAAAAVPRLACEEDAGRPPKRM